MKQSDWKFNCIGTAVLPVIKYLRYWKLSTTNILSNSPVWNLDDNAVA